MAHTPVASFSFSCANCSTATGADQFPAGVFLRDLTFIEDGNPNTVEDGQINFEKTKLLGSVIRGVQQYQQYPYTIRKIPSIVRYLRKAMVLPEDPDDTIYDLSLQVEPRAPESQPADAAQ